MNDLLISSPLQGFTDFRFRNTFNKYFGGIDVFYAPYIRLDKKNEIKTSIQRDLYPENNTSLNLKPQIMTNNADEFLFVADYVKNLGYDELNWNLGCPYPMVTKRGLGSGLLKYPERIHGILKEVCLKAPVSISIKMRLGNESNQEILSLLPFLEEFPLKFIAIHPRIGKQLYKGKTDMETFNACIEKTSHTIYYNGEIRSVENFRELKNKYPGIKHWMIGRGIIANPFLAYMIKNDTIDYPEDWTETFGEFHDSLFEQYAKALSGGSHILAKMLSYWEYFSQSFSDPHKALKKIKKAKTIGSYEAAVSEILSAEKRNGINLKY